MLEIEVKYRVGDLEAVEQRLRAWGAAQIEERNDIDVYFNAPHRDFAQTDEALRIRSIGARNLVTYKGPRIDKETKTRHEIEIPLGDGEETRMEFARLLIHLGFRNTALVGKHRRILELNRDGYAVHVSLDNVIEVGSYVELEIVAEESQFEPARAVVLKCAAELGLTEMERRSYLELLLEKRSTANG